ncbi:class I SAM-dependent methyltransferase [Colwellia sp. 12G3]|uniref:class I SAM-dependent methyltransferase n=1 Tax=Colwellia sp. 12G3 TaxID=2058299 RepID=UPI000C335E13|nr:class I SAM-dependent methyltransferase [Colwellia sp. 12G3]PKI17095.1 hypothetical protein CXF71_07640 [Colwellia sp. 12G3]
MGYINKNDSEYWNDYWSQGHKTSFGGTFINGYEGIIKNIWEDYFDSLRDNSQVLDLCTGNASLLRLAQNSQHRIRGISFTGVDYAQIDTTDGFGGQAGINLIFGINIEKLPFENKIFNYVISNFGIEYSDLSQSVAEASRVLLSGGELQFVCHCHDSILIKSNRHELEMLIQMFCPSDVLDNLTELIDALTDREVNNPQKSAEQIMKFQEACKIAERVRLELNESITYMADTFKKPFQESDFIGFLRYLLNSQCEDKQQALSLFKADLHSHKARLTAMINSALTKEQLATLKNLLKKNQLSKLSVNDVVNEDGKIACRISAVKE